MNSKVIKFIGWSIIGVLCFIILAAYTYSSTLGIESQFVSTVFNPEEYRYVLYGMFGVVCLAVLIIAILFILWFASPESRVEITEVVMAQKNSRRKN